MSDPILALLQHDDPQQRKRGISAAAKRADARYLKVLAQIVKTDPEGDVRQMAKKAGAYIHQQRKAATPAPAVGPTPAAASPSPNFSRLIDSEGRELNPEQAAQHYDKAFDLHIKGNNAHAVLELATAFYLNPAYGDDLTAVTFATEMTGLPPEQAVRTIGDPDKWRILTDKYGGFGGKPATDDQRELQMIYVWVLGAVAVIVVFAVLVWLFQSGLISEAVQQTINSNRDSVIIRTPPPVVPTLTP